MEDLALALATSGFREPAAAASIGGRGAAAAFRSLGAGVLVASASFCAFFLLTFFLPEAVLPKTTSEDLPLFLVGAGWLGGAFDAAGFEAEATTVEAAATEGELTGFFASTFGFCSTGAAEAAFDFGWDLNGDDEVDDLSPFAFWGCFCLLLDTFGVEAAALVVTFPEAFFALAFALVFAGRDVEEEPSEEELAALLLGTFLLEADAFSEADAFGFAADLSCFRLTGELLLLDDFGLALWPAVALARFLAGDGEARLLEMLLTLGFFDFEVDRSRPLRLSEFDLLRARF